jgi:hypothetical protein
MGKCVHYPILQCCENATMCDDGNTCTRDTCEGSCCHHDYVPGCCNCDNDCEDGERCDVSEHKCIPPPPREPCPCPALTQGSAWPQPIATAEWKVTFVGATAATATGARTFTYRINVVGGSGCRGLSHWNLAPCLCTSLISAPGSSGQIGKDPTTGLTGIKWEQQLECGQSKTFTITVTPPAGYEVTVGDVLYSVKGSVRYAVGIISGPVVVQKA